MHNIPVETHPFEPFLPPGARVLMLGTFPPKPLRWSMKFYYPNRTNDMWRVMGLIFLGDRDHFWDTDAGAYRLVQIKQFLTSQGIALYDTAVRVQRLKDNASDKFLHIVQTVDLKPIFARCPGIQAVVTTGQKATDVIAGLAGVESPKIGIPASCQVGGHAFKLVRMPSTSRAYPLALEKKAQAYRDMFRALGYAV